MKTLKKIKLHNIAQENLADREMNILRLVHVDVMGPLLWLIIKRLINMQAYEE